MKRCSAKSTRLLRTPSLSAIRLLNDQAGNRALQSAAWRGPCRRERHARAVGGRGQDCAAPAARGPRNAIRADAAEQRRPDRGRIERGRVVTRRFHPPARRVAAGVRSRVARESRARCTPLFAARNSARAAVARLPERARACARSEAKPPRNPEQLARKAPRSRTTRSPAGLGRGSVLEKEEKPEAEFKPRPWNGEVCLRLPSAVKCDPGVREQGSEVHC